MTCSADYDCDGDLDLFVSGVAAQKGLFRNDRANGLNWVEFQLVGSGSNRSALGARVSVRAMIKGQPRWQMREISAQNSFNGHNDLTQHFGLREAAGIDSVRIEWPSGRVEVATDLAANAKYDVKEGDARRHSDRACRGRRAITDGGAVRIVWSGGAGVPAPRSSAAQTWVRAGPWSLSFHSMARAGSCSRMHRSSRAAGTKPACRDGSGRHGAFGCDMARRAGRPRGPFDCIRVCARDCEPYACGFCAHVRGSDRGRPAGAARFVRPLGTGSRGPGARGLFGKRGLGFNR